jgi:hypothetical protein
MLGRIFSIVVIVGAAYWYWSGPYQARVHPSHEAQLEKNAENMRLCVRGIAYKAGATGMGSADGEKSCAEKYNVYEKDGKWHSYDQKRTGN